MDYAELLLSGVGAVALIVGAVVGIVKFCKWAAEVNSDRENYGWYKDAVNERVSNNVFGYFKSEFESFKERNTNNLRSLYDRTTVLEKTIGDFNRDGFIKSLIRIGELESRADVFNTFIHDLGKAREDLNTRVHRLENPAPCPAQVQPAAGQWVTKDLSQPKHAKATVDFVKELPVELS